MKRCLEFLYFYLCRFQYLGKKCLSNLYAFLKISKIIYTIEFLLHRYSMFQFDAIHTKNNIQKLFQLQEGDLLESTSSGKLSISSSSLKKKLFFIRNLFFLGAYKSRMQKVVYFSFLTFSLEFKNPFNIELLKFFIQRKVDLSKRLLDKLEPILSKKSFSSLVYHLESFEKNSLIQRKIIKEMNASVRRQKMPSIVQDAKNALKKGLSPLLIIKGFSGSYWMRGTSREILGLFKPFDEEIFAPNNPIGPKMQGSLGKRELRIGVKVGEAAHREVAAFLVDEFFGFGIVPKTYYASFTHPVFFIATENRYQFKKTKTKKGSFQEYVQGFDLLDNLTKEEKALIPLDEFQLMVLLDVIIGNLDRNIGNFLVSEGKIVAIDHGLSFPDTHLDDLSLWYCSYLKQGQHLFYPAMVSLLENFPFERLTKKLKKRCFISASAIECMRERLALFSEGVFSSLPPETLEKLMTSENLLELRESKGPLKEKAQKIVKNFLEQAHLSEQKPL